MQIDCFLKLEAIPGESKDKDHTDWIDVLSWTWGIQQFGTMHAQGGGGGGKASFNDLTVSAPIDKSAPILMQKCARGTHIPKATLINRKAGDSPLEYMKIEMKDVMVTSVSTGGVPGSPEQTFDYTVNFAEVKVSYQEQDKTGGAKGGTVDFAWSIEQNTDL